MTPLVRGNNMSQYDVVVIDAPLPAAILRLSVLRNCFKTACIDVGSKAGDALSWAAPV